MSTFFLPPAAVVGAAATPVDHKEGTTERGSSFEEEGEFRSGSRETDPQWFAMGIEKNNAALFQAACMGYRRQLSDAVRHALQVSNRDVSDTEFSVIVDCLVDVAFASAKQHREDWNAFTPEDRVKWLSQFAEEAVDYFDTL